MAEPELQQEAPREAPRPRIFQIGFNKCGTRSLYAFLKGSGIESAHFNRGRLAQTIHDNIEAGRKPLWGVERYTAYTDMQVVARDGVIEAFKYFREFHRYYPGSRFILNTRGKEGWIKSRVNHGAGFFVQRYQRALGLADEDAVLAHWSQDWDRHHADVASFFADKPGQLLVFDIEQHGPERLVDFLAPEFETDARLYGHAGDTAKVDPEQYRRNRGRKAGG
ncbi:MAG: sulfotransferase [Pseudomonadota bacterium]